MKGNNSLGDKSREVVRQNLFSIKKSHVNEQLDGSRRDNEIRDVCVLYREHHAADTFRRIYSRSRMWSRFGIDADGEKYPNLLVALL